MRESPKMLDSGSFDGGKHQQTVCESTQTVAPSLNQAPQFSDRDRILAWLSENVPAKRLQHILRVEAMAIELAEHHQLDVGRAAQAGLMHDLAKYFKPQRLLQMAQTHALALDPILESNPHLLHADVSAIVAQAEFGIQDVDVLEAIRHHTLGSPGMGLLSCVVFLADSLEPGRGDSAELTTLRQASRNDLHRAVWLTSEYTLQFLFAKPSLIHPRLILTRNWAMQMSAKKTTTTAGTPNE